MRLPALASLLSLAALAAVGCVADPADEAGPGPNDGMLRDFVDGKFDAAGHPLNAKVTEAESICALAGTRLGGVIRLSQTPCTGALAGDEQHGTLVASLRVRVASYSGTGRILTATLIGSVGNTIATQQLTAQQLRSTSWIDVPLTWTSAGEPVTVKLEPAPGTLIDLDYIEVFPSRFGLVASPGSGVHGDGLRLVLELPPGRGLDMLDVDDVDLKPRLTELVRTGKATRTTTDYRTLIDVSLGDLAPQRDDSAELELRVGSFAARAQLRRTPTPCSYEGDPTGIKVLITGFQPFPADGWHANVSEVAVWALHPAQLRGAQVMRVVMPVEYDRSAAQLKDIITRCAPQAVLSFGQGGGEIALEQVAYNLQDTGEVAGGVPDNRGVIRAAAPIDAGAPQTRNTLLPLQDIASAMFALGVTPHMSIDPGRYICNNVMFESIGAMAARGGVGGFIHLPYTITFDNETNERFGKIVQAAVQATADSLR